MTWEEINRMMWEDAIRFCEEHECEECSVEDKRTEYQKKVLQYLCCWNLVNKEKMKVNKAVQEMIKEIINMLNDEMEYGIYDHPLNCVAKVPLNSFFKAIGELNALLTILKGAENESNISD